MSPDLTSSARHHRAQYLTCLVVLITLINLTITTNSAYGQAALGSIRVEKGVDQVTENGWVLHRVRIVNNGSIPVFDIEINEFFNANFNLGNNATVSIGNQESSYPLAGSGGLGTSFSQFILNLPPGTVLQPGETATVRYWAYVPGAGDFQIPPSLVWYQFKYFQSDIRLGLYSNGLLVRLPSEFERIIMRIFPYIIAMLSFVIALIALWHLRRSLSQ